MARPRKKRNKDEVKRSRRRGDLSAADALVKGLSHPMRVKALTILTDRVASPAEIATELGVRVSNVSYHVRVLEELGLVELMEEEPVRGAVAHFYKAAEPGINAEPAWNSLNPKVRSAFSNYIVDALFSDFARSASADLLDRRDDRLLSRTPLVLDEAGWARVLEIQASAQQKIIEEQAAAADRIEGTRENAIEAILGLWFFEVPAERPQDE